MSTHQDVRRKVRLASLLIKEVSRRSEENQELSPDQNRQPDESKEYDQKGEGEGVLEESGDSKAVGKPEKRRMKGMNLELTHRFILHSRGSV